ncbi:hypothetical protein XNC3_1960032 [Xenorhabdus nematophila F1]|nr:hypothetical protein XNC3_1960032 [Xenorhabdus nematophila F1]
MEKYRGCEAKLSYVVRVYFGIRTMHEYNAFYRRARMCFMESYFLLKPPVFSLSLSHISNYE